MRGATSIVVRLALAATLVLATFNPLGASYYHYAKQTLPAVNGLFALVSVVLLIGWVALLRATFRSLGLLGTALVSLLLGALVWVGADAGLVDLRDGTLRTWLALAVVTLVLTAGLAWSDLRRQLTGQATTIEEPRAE